MSVLSPEQVDAYLERLELPQTTKDWLHEGSNGEHALEALTTLQQYHMAAVPFENLELHYSSHKSFRQETAIAYEDVVTRKRGGACPQVHQLFTTLLRSLGFHVYCTGGRLNAPASPSADPNIDKSVIKYGPWVHVNMIVTIGTEKYIVDTNFGSFGCPYPIPLVHNQPTTDLWPRTRRVMHESIPGWACQDQKWWRIQLRENDDAPWMDVCCFMEHEWLPLDFVVMVDGLDALGTGWFRFWVTCFRLILEEQKPVGYVMIWGDELRRMYKGELEILQKFYSESDRVNALEEEFGITLSDEEVKHMEGSPAELKETFDFYDEE